MPLIPYDDIFGGGSVISQISEMPTMRPFLFAEIPGKEDLVPGSTSGFVIDDARNPETGKFRFLRSFKYAVGEAPNVEFVLFDDRGHIDETLLNVYNTFVARDGMDTVEPRFYITFQWGWSIPIVDPMSDTLVEKRIVSAIHKMAISGVEISYEDGGIAYKIVGADVLTVINPSIQKQITPMTDITSAMVGLLQDNLQKPRVNSPIFAEGDRAPQNQLRKWQMNGMTPIETLRNWSNQILSKRGQPIRLYWSPIQNALVVEDVPVGFVDAWAEEIAGPHVVNYWDQSEIWGGTIVTKFDPKIMGPAQTGSMTQIGFVESGERKIHETMNSSETNPPLIDEATGQQVANMAGKGLYKAGLKGQGTQMRVPPKAPDDPVPSAQYATAMEKRIGASHRNMGTGGFYGASASLECIGWPRADRVEVIYGRPIYLIVYDPFGFDSVQDGIASDFLVWNSRGPNEYLSGAWFVRAVSHLIDDTGYRMVMDCARINDADTQGLPPVGSTTAPPTGGA